MVPVHSETSILSEWARSRPRVTRRELKGEVDSAYARVPNHRTQFKRIR